MDFQNNSCVQNITDAAIKQKALAVGIPGIVCFLLNLVGLAAEFIFVCKKKNTLLLRLFIYLSIAVTLAVGCYSSSIVMYLIWPEDQFLCQIEHTFFQYSVTVELSVVLSVTILLLYKVCRSFQLSSRKSIVIQRVSSSQWKCLEALFVVLNFGIPAVALSAFFAIQQNVGACLLTMEHSIECFIEKGFILEFLIFESIPVFVVTLLCVLCICVLLVWPCWLRTRGLLKAQIKTVIKEIGVWLGFLVIFCIMVLCIEIYTTLHHL